MVDSDFRGHHSNARSNKYRTGEVSEADRCLRLLKTTVVFALEAQYASGTKKDKNKIDVSEDCEDGFLNR